jgi:hypothetical protein
MVKNYIKIAWRNLKRNKVFSFINITGMTVAICMALLAVAIVISCLQDFAYHIDVKSWVFLLAGIFAILIAFFTISVQSVKAALMNPVKSLKTD